MSKSIMNVFNGLKVLSFSDVENRKIIYINNQYILVDYSFPPYDSFEEITLEEFKEYSSRENWEQV